jgi:hypothetical protein
MSPEIVLDEPQSLILRLSCRKPMTHNVSPHHAAASSFSGSRRFLAGHNAPYQMVELFNAHRLSRKDCLTMASPDECGKWCGVIGEVVVVLLFLLVYQKSYDNSTQRPKTQYRPVCTGYHSIGYTHQQAIRSPLTQPAKGEDQLGIRKPIAERLMNAPAIATERFGNSINGIGMMSTSPNHKPAIRPILKRDI